MASIINENMNIINKSRYNFLKNILKSFLYIYPLRFKLRVSIESPIPSINTKVESMQFIYPLELSLVGLHKNYKSYYSSRLDSIFGSKLPIRSSSKFVFDCGYTDIPFCNHFINHPMQKVNSSQTIGTIL